MGSSAEPVCLHCGYSLEGLTAEDVCPECGEPTRESFRQAARIRVEPIAMRRFAIWCTLLGLVYLVALPGLLILAAFVLTGYRQPSSTSPYTTVVSLGALFGAVPSLLWMVAARSGAVRRCGFSRVSVHSWLGLFATLRGGALLTIAVSVWVLSGLSGGFGFGAVCLWLIGASGTTLAGWNLLTEVGRVALPGKRGNLETLGTVSLSCSATLGWLFGLGMVLGTLVLAGGLFQYAWRFWRSGRG